MKIVILDGYTTNPGDLSWEVLEKLGEVTVYDRSSEDEVVPRSEGAEVVLTNKTRIRREHFEALPNLKLICVMATGFDVVDIEAGSEFGVKVANVRGYSTPSVVQHTFALTLALLNRVGHHSDDVRKGGWNSQPDFSYWHSTIYELEGKTMGIIGLGTIGKAVARVAIAFGMKVISPRRNSEMEGVELLTLEEVTGRSDIISLHCPLTKHNTHMINTGFLSEMRDSALLINTARGGLVDIEALHNALKNGQIGGAGLDVLEAEPPVEPLDITDLDNCLITPHQAWASLEARSRLLEGLAENIKGYKEGREINIVN